MILDKIIKSIILITVVLAYHFVMPDNIVDGAAADEIGWKSHKNYYVFPILMFLFMLYRIMKTIFVHRFYMVTSGTIAPNETGEKDATIHYRYNDETYASVYRHSKSIMPDWDIIVHFHPNRPNDAIFDVWHHARNSMFFLAGMFILSLSINYYSA